MAIHAALRHRTHYTYDRPVAHAPHVVRLRPAPHCRAKVLAYTMKVEGGTHFLNWQQDPFSNWNARLVFPDKMTEFAIEVELIAEMAVHNPFDFFLEESASAFPFAYDALLAKDLAPFLEKAPVTPRFEAFLQKVRHALIGEGSAGIRTIDFIVALNREVQQEVGYLIRLEAGVQLPEETLEKRSGSCRDSAWLLCAVARHLGLAARFVSGYLIQLKSDVKALDGPSGTETDFTDLHAWCEVFLPGAGWIGLDPTSGLLAGEGHLPLSCTPEPASAAPVTGALDPCEAKLHHEMQVTRIFESPRVTKPYTDAQWQAIDALGRQIDVDLEQNDTRLTMGGEPTFISIDDPDGPEWNFTAVSEKKRLLSADLLHRLRSEFSPGALIHFGQGKWYPGEPLPRWALSAYWRKDGVPIWKNDALIADEAKDYSCGAKESKMLAAKIATLLGVETARLIPAYEDVFYYMWKERRLPSNVTPEESHLHRKEERDRFARLFQEGIGSVVGYALPLRRGPDGRWRSSSWFLRDEDKLWLIPGDSPMGLRLPLDSIPFVAEKDYPWVTPQDPTQSLPPLTPTPPKPVTAGISYTRPFVPSNAPPVQAPKERRQEYIAASPAAEIESETARVPKPGESAPWVVRTALCVESRHGRLHVFMPPVATVEDYFALVSVVETAVDALGFTVIIEGETPPNDPRVQKLAVTPDPGVIEVNLHPSKSWAELVHRTTFLYEQARLARLGTEKFMLDGRHTGTGGGNHIILGGETPADSPVLRRPDLLRSLLTYWQNHPALSWIFSGLFIGPTSQAPRIDEARHDALYELEVAFQQLPSRGEPTPLWLVDRLFRNLLVDASGNTHRAEFSIDKLYSPDGATGRLGLVEMRAFEMPPHAQMSLAQHLLLRALVAKFWRRPYTQRLIPWGTDLHDRWMLPHFCESDLRDVLRDLRDDGYAFEPEWFAPHLEFRFPRIGDFAQRDVKVEIRCALEPWHVLGEEAGPGGYVRHVDSSLERVQVKANGLVGDRFLITCNGRHVPLHSTGTNGEGVAGVRYRAWQPPRCLHPTIGVHAPLVFELYDTWNQRSLGGCTYHVAHPGGRNYTTFPVNAYEAESRRLARFETFGHRPGYFALPSEPVNRAFPFTLDLRYT
jgi:uncharacterized protein (DUF2126 family)